MKLLTGLAGAAGFVTVALGAFGAHGLEGKLTPEAQDWWQTATFYGLTHAVAAFTASEREGSNGAAIAFLVGALIFSGSLYAMALGGPRSLGMITPIGGVSFLAGWAMIAVSGFRAQP